MDNKDITAWAKEFYARLKKIETSENSTIKLAVIMYELEKAFPELKESEDERIRKELLEEIEFIIPHDDETDSEGLILPSYHARIDRYKSYLEKQKEQQDVKVISWREPDDCTDIPEGHYVVIAYKPGVFGLGYIENGKVVCAPGQKPSGILYIPNADESIIVESKEQKPTEWSEEEKMHLYNAIEAVKYVYDVSEGTGGFKCVEFLKSLRPQPKAEWSESDSSMLCDIVGYINGSGSSSGITKQERVDFLYGLPKRFNLQPKYWKPSKDEITAAEVAVKYLLAHTPDEQLRMNATSVFEHLKQL